MSGPGSQSCPASACPLCRCGRFHAGAAGRCLCLVGFSRTLVGGLRLVQRPDGGALPLLPAVPCRRDDPGRHLAGPFRPPRGGNRRRAAARPWLGAGGHHRQHARRPHSGLRLPGRCGYRLRLRDPHRDPGEMVSRQARRHGGAGGDGVRHGSAALRSPAGNVAGRRPRPLLFHHSPHLLRAGRHLPGGRDRSGAVLPHAAGRLAAHGMAADIRRRRARAASAAPHARYLAVLRALAGVLPGQFRGPHGHCGGFTAGARNGQERRRAVGRGRARPHERLQRRRQAGVGQRVGPFGPQPHRTRHVRLLGLCLPVPATRTHRFLAVAGRVVPGRFRVRRVSGAAAVPYRGLLRAEARGRQLRAGIHGLGPVRLPGARLLRRISRTAPRPPASSPPGTTRCT